MNTSTFAAHVTALEGRRKASTVGSQLTVRGGFCLLPTVREGFSRDLRSPTDREGSCRGWMSPEGEEELRAKRDENFDMGLVLGLELVGLLVL